MHRLFTAHRAFRAAIAAVSASIFAGTAFAGISINAGSTAKITHYAEENNAGTFSTKNVNPPPTGGSMPTPSTYQYSKTLSLNGGSSSASASVGGVTTAQTVGWTFASGTGLSQTDPSGSSFSGPALLKFTLNGTWDVTSGGFGSPSAPAYGYFCFTLGGTIPTGDTASVDMDLTWKDVTTNTTLRSAVNTLLNFTHSSTLPSTYTNSLVFSPTSIPSGHQIQVNGTITFRATDPGATVSFNPLEMEFSSAPPTYRFTPGASGQNWLDPNNWRNDMSLPVTIPNGIGSRAVFNAVTSSTAGPIDTQSGITIGMLDIDQPALRFGTGTVTFDTAANHAVLYHRNTHNFTPGEDTVVNAPVVLNDTLDIINDSPNTVDFNGVVSDGTGGPAGIVKSGFGRIDLNAPNTFTGGVEINQGFVSVGANGALGTNVVNINGGAIGFLPAVTNPFSAPVGSINVNSNSQANVGNTNSAIRYVVNDLGCISGDASQYSTIIKGNNYFPAFGSMVAHQTFDTGIPGNPVNLSLGLPGPSYIFGIATDFNSPVGTESMTVGSASGSPWVGFGLDKSPHVFGGGAQSLGIAGNAHLVALGSHLDMNAPISGPPGAVIVKRGAGLVAINSIASNFLGATEVQSGPLAVNGTWISPSTQVDAGAALGGTGNITGAVSFLAGSFLKPGLLGNVATFANDPVSVEGPGTLHTGPASFAGTTHLLYNLNTPNVAGGTDNDLLAILGNLTLDGILDIDAGLEFNTGTYTLMTYTGTLTNNLLQLGNTPLDDFPGMQIVIEPGPGGIGGSVLLTVPIAAAIPEPGAIGLLGLAAVSLVRRRTR